MEASTFSLSDKVFWHVYWDMYVFGGIVSQFYFQIRWHVVQCLESGFSEDDARLVNG